MRKIRLSIFLLLAVLFLPLATPLCVQAMPGNAAQFASGSNSFIAAASSTELKTFSALTLEAWIKPSGGGEWATIMGKQYNGANANPWWSYRLYVASNDPSEQGFPRRVALNIAPVSTGGEVGVASTTVVQNDVWTHVAGVYDGATMKIYINGTLENTVAQTGDLKESDLPMYIGKAPWTNYNNYNGQMDELRIWNVARTQAQIQYAMNRSLLGNEEGLVAYWPFNDAAGSPTADDASQYNHVGTSYNGAAIVADSTAPINMDFIAQTGMPLNTIIVSNPITVTGISSPVAISITDGEYSVSINDGTAWSAFSSTTPATISLNNQVKVRQPSSSSHSTLTTATLNIGGLYDEFFNVTTAAVVDPNASGLIVWWKAENNTYDSVGGIHGTAMNGATYDTGRVGQAFGFDGSNQYINIARSASLEPNNITVEFRMKQNGEPAQYTPYLAKTRASGPYGGFLFNKQDYNRMSFQANINGGWYVLTGTTSLTPGEWYHIVGTYDGSALKLYVNGILDGEVTAIGILNYADASTDLKIANCGDQPQLFFNGKIDEVKIFSRALSALEISTLAGTNPDAFSFTAQTGMPVSATIVSNPITVTGISSAAAISITGGPGSAYQINGGSWTSSAETVSNGDIVKVRQTSSASNSTLTTTTLTVGGVSGEFNVTTAASGNPNANGLVAWWRAESSAFDSVGGNNGIWSGTSAYAPGITGEAFSLNGNSKVSMLTFDMGSDWTIVAWVNPLGCSDNSHCPVLARSLGNQDGLVLTYLGPLHSSANQFALDIGNGAWQVLLYSGATYQMDQWYHVVASKSGDTYSLYVDGTLNAQQTVSGVSTSYQSRNMEIGHWFYSVGEAYTTGLIDEVKIFNRALSALEISTLAGTSSSLYATFPGAGVYQYNGTAWSQVTPNSPEAMTVAGSLLYGDFGSSGIWMYNGTTWSQTTPSDPQMMTVSGSTLYGAFSGAGIWQWNGTSWSQATPSNPEAILASGSLLYGDFGTSGIWMYNGTTWSQTTPSDPQMMTVSGSNLYGAFSGAGIWMYNGTTWSQTTPSNPEAILASGLNLYGDFGSYGIWMYNGTTWSQLSPLNPEQMVCTATDLYADLGSAGIWKYNGTTWSQVTPNDPASMVTGY